MPGKQRKQKVWVWLTVQQIDAVLAVARVIDATPDALEAILPERGERAAFRGVITVCKNVRGAMETSE